MNLRLVPLDEKYKKQLFDMMEEWSGTGEQIVPYAIRRCDYHDFDSYRDNLENKNPTPATVPDTTLFA